MIAVVEWGAAASLKENVRFFQRAVAAGRVLPPEWRDQVKRYHSLTLWEDGTCELQHFSAVAVARRLGCSIVRTAARKARMGKRG